MEEYLVTTAREEKGINLADGPKDFPAYAEGNRQYA